MQIVTIEQLKPYRNYKIRKGVYARFFQISKTLGIKWFTDKRVCDATYSRQQWAATHGLGPAVGEQVIVSFCGKPYSGYYTEAAIKLLEREVRCGRYEGNECNLMAELEDRLESIGIIERDLNEQNIGYISSGQWVALDFSNGTTGGFHKDWNPYLTNQLSAV
jgi:hypothetical protein